MKDKVLLMSRNSFKFVQFIFNMKIILALFVLIAFQAYSQQMYFVKDAIDQQSIPFVKVYPDHGDPFIADLDGAFTLSSDVSEVRIHCTGYLDSVITISNVVNGIILLTPESQIRMDEVVVIAGENPAHRIIQQVIERRKENHPLSKDAFRYNSYSKFIFDADREMLGNIPDTTTDSTLIEMRDFFNEQHLFIVENSTKRAFIPPFKDKEEITAYKASGFNDPLISNFVNGMQSFCFYDNQFDLLGTQYINPIALGGIRRYLFVLEDTTVVASDTTFTIYYRPRSNKDFQGMEGRLYINTNGYAIEKVTASPYPNNGPMRLDIIQEYELIDGKRWFPVKLNTKIETAMATIKVGDTTYPILGSGSTYIENIELNPSDMERIYDDNIKIATTEDAGTLEEEKWDELRKYELTDLEKRTYVVIDSIAEEYNFDKYIRMMKILMDGNIPAGKFNIPIASILNYNQFEGLRLGLGLETSDKLMKSIILGGYGAYGFKDKAFKYGTYSKIYLNRRRDIYFQLRYQEDVLERGGFDPKTNAYSLTSTDALRRFFISSMEYQRLAEVAFNFDIKANMTVKLYGNFQRINTTQGYQFPLNSTDSISTFDVAETGLLFNWNFGEEYMLIGNKKVSLDSKKPKLSLHATKGWDNWFTSDLSYYRLNVSLYQNYKFKLAGSLNWKVEFALTEGNVPQYLLLTPPSTGINYSLSVPSTFETIAPNSYYTDRLSAIYVRYLAPEIKTKAKWNEPQFGLHLAGGIGRNRGIPESNLSYKTMEKGYAESGLMINNLLVSGFSGLGIGGFYNWGPYTDTDWKKNVMIKFTVSFAF